MTDRDEARERVVREVAEEAARAASIHPPFNSPHEGWAVIQEELCELWEHVMSNTGRGVDARKEAVQIAAMATNYAAELTEET